MPTRGPMAGASATVYYSVEYPLHEAECECRDREPATPYEEGSAGPIGTRCPSRQPESRDSKHDRCE